MYGSTDRTTPVSRGAQRLMREGVGVAGDAHQLGGEGCGALKEQRGALVSAHEKVSRRGVMERASRKRGYQPNTCLFGAADGRYA